VSPADGIAIEAASIGAGLVREARGQRDSIRTKSSPTDPVTELDLAVEQVIREHLAARTPGASFLGEEEGARGVLRWLDLDPSTGR
jgi:myo-inositol-1(or 4)-monophosphatase